ncbi:MAG: DUF721 domain-containing protein [Flavobacteriales bacterium]|nr:DUF721 domain-containing protein [Flavobacteriales bacterium]
MKKFETLPLSQLLRQWFSQEEAGQEIFAQMLRRVWDRALGPMVAHRTGRMSVKNHVLTVEITSPVLRSELMALRPEILKTINAHLGPEEALKDIRFL